MTTQKLFVNTYAGTVSIGTQIGYIGGVATTRLREVFGSDFLEVTVQKPTSGRWFYIDRKRTRYPDESKWDFTNRGDNATLLCNQGVMRVLGVSVLPKRIYFRRQPNIA